MIGKAEAGRDQHFHQHTHSSVTIDVGLVTAMAEAQGYLSPEAAQALKDQVARTQADLDALRRTNEAWGAEVDKVIAAFNASEPDKAREAFARIDALIDAKREDRATEQRRDDLAQAKSKHAQATLLYPFEASKAAPLLRQAAEVAETNV